MPPACALLLRLRIEAIVSSWLSSESWGNLAQRQIFSYTGKNIDRRKEGVLLIGTTNILRNPRRLPKECGAGGSILKTWGQPSPDLVSDSSKEFPFLDCRICKYGNTPFPRRTALMQPNKEGAINSLICFLPGEREVEKKLVIKVKSNNPHHWNFK